MIEKRPGLLLVLLAVVLFVFGVFVAPNPILIRKEIGKETKPQTRAEPKPNLNGSQFIESREFDELVAKVQRDIEQILNQKIHITVLVGPYFRYVGLIAFLSTYNESYYSLNLDSEFLEELTDKEKNAVILHELGHILYRPPPNSSRSQAIEAEVLADSFITKYPEYASVKDMLRLLDKASNNYLIRRRHLEQLAQSR